MADPFRPDAQETHYPGDANFRRADVIVINKANTAPKARRGVGGAALLRQGGAGRAPPAAATVCVARRAASHPRQPAELLMSSPPAPPRPAPRVQEGVTAVAEAAARLNPRARVIATASEVTVACPAALRGRRVVVLEDGPTLTHGGLPTGALLLPLWDGGWGAGTVGPGRAQAACVRSATLNAERAKRCDARTIAARNRKRAPQTAPGAGCIAASKYGAIVVDPRPHFVGELAATLKAFPHIGPVVPAMGYSEQQVGPRRGCLTAGLV